MSRLCMLLGTAMVGAVACGTGKGSLGGGPELDARLISDVRTWDCQTGSTDTGVEHYQGVFEQDVRLYYAPDALPALELPAAGSCSYGLDMFPDSAGSGASSLDGVSTPGWRTDASSGTLEPVATGVWSDQPLDPKQHFCQPVEEVLQGGTELTDAGALTGARTPEPPNAPEVTWTSEDDSEAISWGEHEQASWDDTGWDEMWVQVRREKEGEAWESVTCNVTGQSSFTISDDVWALMNESLNVDLNNLYVAFQKSDTQTMDDGEKVEVLTRVMAVAVVLEE